MYKVKNICIERVWCPTQIIGNLEGGEYFYIRYRHGILSMEVDGELVYKDTYGDDFCGVISIDEIESEIEELFLSSDVEWVIPDEVEQNDLYMIYRFKEVKQG